MKELLQSPFLLRLAWTLLHFLWQGTLLGLAAWLTLALLRSRSARMRYTVACGFLLLCLLAPLATFRLLPSFATLSTTTSTVATFLPAMPATAESISAAPTALRPTMVMRAQPFLPWIVPCWLLGIALLTLRVAGSWLWLQRLQRGGAPVAEAPWQERLKAMARSAGIRRVVRLLESPRLRSPLSMGVFRPLILVPLGFFAQLDPAAAEAVLAHELAHIRRLDALVNGVQCLIETLLFFHPAVWWISRRVRTERECCCDDEAVMACGDVVLYAETLSRLDAWRERPQALAQAARGGNLMERIKRLLSRDSIPLRIPSAGLVLAFALVAGSVLLAAQAAPLPPAPPAPEAPAPVAPPAPPPAPKPPKPPAALAGLPGDPTVSILKPSLFEALDYLASARKFNLIIDPDITDVKAPIKLLDCPWSQAAEAILRTHQLGMELHGNVLRIAKEWRLRPETPRPAPAVPPAPAAPAASAPKGEFTTTTSSFYRRVKFTLRQGKDGVVKLRIEAARTTREELLEALKKIEHLAKAGVDPDRPLQGEWTLATAKEENANWLTFELDGVTTQSVRELYK